MPASIRLPMTSAPFDEHRYVVRPEWIDDNGHLNMATTWWPSTGPPTPGSTTSACPPAKGRRPSVHARLLPHIPRRFLVRGEPDASLRLHVVDQPLQRDNP